MIRLATPDDLPVILDLGERMHLESRFKALPFSRGKVAALFTHLMTGPGVVFVAVQDGRIIGGIAGLVIEHWFSTVKVAQDFGLFIEPEHRGGMLAMRLLKSYEKWARESGAASVEMGINTGVKVVETGKLLELMGYTLAATLHAKEF